MLKRVTIRKVILEPFTSCQSVTSTHLKFYSLTFVFNKDDVTIGRPDIGSYAAFPSQAAVLLQQLQAGLSVNTAVEWYYQQYREMVDIYDFINTMQELGFIRGDAEESEVRIYPVPWFWQCLSNAAFSPVAWVLYIVLFGYSVYEMYRIPSLIPVYGNLFFSPYFSVIELGLLLGQISGTLFHEFYHSLAGKQLGLPSRLGIGYRLGYIVLETDLTSLWSVPRRSRYLPLLAGMLADVISFSLLTIIAGFCVHHAGIFSFIASYCAALAFSTVMRFLWQFKFYLQTDLYYVITNTLECINLQHVTRIYLRNCVFRFIGHFDKLEDETLWHSRDRQIAHWYMYCYLSGYSVTIGIYLFVGLPVLFRVLYGVYTHLFSWHLSGSFWDSCAILLLSVLQIIVLMSIFIRNHKQKQVSHSFRT